LARGSKSIGPLFPLEDKRKEKEQQKEKVEEPKAIEPKEEVKEVQPPIERTEEIKTPEKVEEKEKDHQPEKSVEPAGDDLKEEEPIQESKSMTDEDTEEFDYFFEAKNWKSVTETHVPLNVRIPKELRKEMDRLKKAAGNKKGFIQDFTIHALQKEVERLKKKIGK
jgi:hypothetical protein